MATGDTLDRIYPRDAAPPVSNYGRADTRNTTTPHDVVDLAVGESFSVPILIPENYGGNGISVILHTTMTSAVANNVQLETSFERIGENAQDMDTDGFATAQNSGDVVVLADPGKTKLITINHTDGAQIDSLVPGESGRLKIARVAATGTEAAGDLEFVRAHLKEN